MPTSAETRGSLTQTPAAKSFQLPRGDAALNPPKPTLDSRPSAVGHKGKGGQPCYAAMRDCERSTCSRRPKMADICRQHQLEQVPWDHLWCHCFWHPRARLQPVCGSMQCPPDSSSRNIPPSVSVGDVEHEGHMEPQNELSGFPAAHPRRQWIDTASQRTMQHHTGARSILATAPHSQLRFFFSITFNPGASDSFLRSGSLQGIVSCENHVEFKVAAAPSQGHSRQYWSLARALPKQLSLTVASALKTQALGILD